MPRLTASACALLTLLVFAAAAPAQDPPPSPPMPGKFELVGHNPLMMRGMNSALAVYGGYAYVGSRTDGSHANAGVMVVDVRDPAKPTVVKEIGLPDEALPTQSSREMRILPDQKLLIILNHQCNEAIHRCVAPSNAGVSVVPSNYKIFDIAGENAANPKLVATYEPSLQGPQTPHEFFIWTDPAKPSRILLFQTDPYGDPQIVVSDLSRVREGIVTDVATFTSDAGGGLHSMTLSHDGRRMYMAALTGGYLVADTSQVAAGVPNPKIVQLTGADDAPTWPGPGAHSAIQLPGRPGRTMITDEVYGQIPGLLSDHGCPWGWVRFIDDSNPAKPAVISEYKLPVNEMAYCDVVPPERNTLASWAAHNPTLTEHLAILSWHSAGLQAIDTTDPARPAGAAEFKPEPLPVVQTEDPVLSSGPDKVVMWSFPVIVDGLIYIVDLRNGLYVLRYRGPHEQEVSRAKFLDGNSNSGDVGRMEAPGGGSGAGGGSGSGPGGTPRGGTPAAGGPAPCQAATPRLSRRGLGAFTLGQTLAQVRLRGGPATKERKASLTYCIQSGGKTVVALRRGRAALVATTSRRVSGAPRGLRPGQRVRRAPRGGFVVRRSGRTSVVARVRARRVAWVGVASGRPSVKALRALTRGTGL